MSTRPNVLADLANSILTVDRPHPLRVGIDGFSAAGKTTLADDLADQIEARGKTALRVSLDSFKLPLERRVTYPLGSPEEYYFEMYDYQAIRTELLEPRRGAGARLTS